jgi:broad specificity phosphatase PhoE
MTAEHDPVFNEAPLPPPMLPRVRYLPKTWNILARAAWLNGHALDGESVVQARLRAMDAAQKLHEASEDAKVYLAAHGWFNRMLRPELKKLGWEVRARRWRFLLEFPRLRILVIPGSKSNWKRL